MAPRSPTVSVRPRADGDLDACAVLARAVHRRDGYPVYGAEDLRGFLSFPDALDAWVAEAGGAIVGHVGLRATDSAELVGLAAGALDRPVEGLGVITRLLVAPDARRLRVGTTLLDHATAASLGLGRWPVLGVDEGSGAVDFYERCGWRRVGRVEVRTPDGRLIPQLVYVAPASRPTLSR